MKKIVAFTGSNNSQSIHSLLVQALANQAKQTEVNTIDLNDFELPMYGLDVEGQGIPENAHKLRATLNEIRCDHHCITRAQRLNASIPEKCD